MKLMYLFGMLMLVQKVLHNDTLNEVWGNIE